MTQHDNCSKSKAKTILENKIWARNSNFWNLNFYPQIGVFLLSPSNSYQGRKMKTRGWSPTEFVWRLCQIFSLKMAPRTKDLQCFHIKWTHCSNRETQRCNGRKSRLGKLLSLVQKQLEKCIIEDNLFHFPLKFPQDWL